MRERFKAYLSIKGKKRKLSIFEATESTNGREGAYNQLVDKFYMDATLNIVDMSQTMRGEEWKRKALGVIPPRLVLGAYREILLHIHLMIPLKLKREYFTLQELEGEMKDFVKGFEPGHIVLGESERCIKILPEAVRKLKEAGLLVLENSGRYRKTRDFDAFWTIINQVRHSAEKMLRWAVYYLLVNGRDSFSTGSFFRFSHILKMN